MNLNLIQITSNKYIFTGNIIREELKKKVKNKKIDDKKDHLDILVMGGSQGSKIINYVLFETLLNNIKYNWLILVLLIFVGI